MLCKVYTHGAGFGQTILKTLLIVVHFYIAFVQFSGSKKQQSETCIAIAVYV